MLIVKLFSIAVTVILTLHVFACIWYRITCPYRKCRNPTVNYILNLTNGTLDIYEFLFQFPKQFSIWSLSTHVFKSTRFVTGSIYHTKSFVEVLQSIGQY